MANAKGRRRRFGALRQLPSGQWQVRYRGPDGVMRPAHTTFPAKTDAEVWLTRKEAEILNGDWINPDAGRVKLAEYGMTWIEERPNLRPKTIRLYRYLFRRHIQPYFGSVTIADIKEAHVRSWRKKLLDSGVSAVTMAKAYRLLKVILYTAVDDGIIRPNPCRIKGAGQEQSAERPVLTIAEVYDLAAAIDPRYRALVLLGTFASLRWAELAALRPCDIDLDTCTIRVVRQLIEQLGGGSAFGPPKSRAGRRAVPFSPSSRLSWPTISSSSTPTTTRRSCSPARWARRCGTATSTAAPGCPPLPRPTCSGIHFHDYADVRVMPTSVRSPCSEAVNGRKLSA
jgi:hypothetical protein